MYIHGCTALLSALIWASTDTAGGEPTPREIMDRQSVATKLDGSEMLSRLVTYDSRGNKRERTIATVSKLFENGKTEKRLLRFVAPADVKGTGLLTYDYETNTDDIWLFMPALRKTRRIISSGKAKNFMGSEFSYADITPPSVDDFTYVGQGQRDVDDVPCWVIEATPKSEKIAKENGYWKRRVYVGQEDFVVRKTLYYDKAGELHKMLKVSKVEQIDKAKGRYRATNVAIYNKQNGRRSELDVLKWSMRLDIPDEYFTARYLERH